MPRNSASEPRDLKATPLDEYIAAVRHLLTTEHGTPVLVADELLTIDSSYVEQAHRGGAMVTEVADELAIKPRQGASWVRLDPGQIVLSINDQVRAYLQGLLALGLFGETIEDAAAALLCRGIEGALPLHGVMPSAGKR